MDTKGHESGSGGFEFNHRWTLIHTDTVSNQERLCPVRAYWFHPCTSAQSVVSEYPAGLKKWHIRHPAECEKYDMRCTMERNVNCRC